MTVQSKSIGKITFVLTLHRKLNMLFGRFLPCEWEAQRVMCTYCRRIQSVWGYWQRRGKTLERRSHLSPDQKDEGSYLDEHSEDRCANWAESSFTYPFLIPKSISLKSK